MSNTQLEYAQNDREQTPGAAARLGILDQGLAEVRNLRPAFFAPDAPVAAPPNADQVRNSVSFDPARVVEDAFQPHAYAAAAMGSSVEALPESPVVEAPPVDVVVAQQPEDPVEAARRAADAAYKAAAARMN